MYVAPTSTKRSNLSRKSCLSVDNHKSVVDKHGCRAPPPPSNLLLGGGAGYTTVKIFSESLTPREPQDGRSQIRSLEIMADVRTLPGAPVRTLT
jgi:hypothetical protein